MKDQDPAGTRIYIMPVLPNVPADIDTLYALLEERQPWQSISHKQMPTLDDHTRFVMSIPYKAWYLIFADRPDATKPIAVGSTYLTEANELGIFIFKRYAGHGYGKKAIQMVAEKHEGPFYANINPANEASRKFFEDLGFKFLQMTYVSGE